MACGNYERAGCRRLTQRLVIRMTTIPRTDRHEIASRDVLHSLRNPDPKQSLIARLRERNSYYGTDAHLAAKLLDEACTLADRAQDYLSVRLDADPLAVNLARELRRFIGRVGHVLVPDSINRQSQDPL